MLRARSGKRDPLRPHEALARASKTLQLSLPGPGEGARRQKVVAPGRASVEGWGEDRPRAANSQEKVTPPGSFGSRERPAGKGRPRPGKQAVMRPGPALALRAGGGAPTPPATAVLTSSNCRAWRSEWNPPRKETGPIK